MNKYKPFSRRTFRRRLGTWAKRNATRLVVLGVGFAGIGATVTTIILSTGLHSRFSWYVLGVLHAVIVTAFFGGTILAFLASDREAIVQLRGAWGEENTRSELQRARRRRCVWGWIDSIGLQIGDLDHLVVTRRAGLLAIDSKWRNVVSEDDISRMAQSARRMQLRAEGLAQSLWKTDRRSRHRARTTSLRVRPVVVLWGPAQNEIPEGTAVVHGVSFVAGSKLVHWLRQLEGEPVSKEAGHHTLGLLAAYRSNSWDAVTESQRS